MAGSYNHVVNDEGGLISNERVAGMLENGGDVFEAVEEMYGMIWYLGEAIAQGQFWEASNPDRGDPKFWIEEARKNYKEGLVLSPTKRYK